MMFSIVNKIKMRRNVPLAQYTTFKIGGPAEYFLISETKDDLIKGINFAKGKGLPFFILGGGSNILVNDDGFKGIVIKIKNSKIKIKKNSSKSRIIWVETGVRLPDLVRFAVEKGLTGLEWAVGIPGTVGGAVKTNAKAFGGEMKKLVKKTEKNSGVIFSIELEMKKGNSQKSKELVKEVIKKRKETQPIEHFSAGCVFKNPTGQSAGYLIEKAGLKGKRVGKAEISQKHANFIINTGGATAGDVVRLINQTKEKIKEKFGVQLEEEIECIGYK